MITTPIIDLLIEKSFSTVKKEKYRFFWEREFIVFNNKKYYDLDTFQNCMEVNFFVIQQIEYKGYEFYIFSDEIRIMVNQNFKHKVPPLYVNITAESFENHVFNKIEAIHKAFIKFYKDYGEYIVPNR